MDIQMKEAYIYTYTNKLNGKVYIGSRSAYKGKAEDDFNIKYFSSSKNREFREAMSNNELEGMIVLKIECENAGKKIIDIESKMITSFWNKYGKELSYNHYSCGKFSTAGIHLSAATIKKIREAESGEKHHFYGKHHSSDTIEKMKESRKGFKHSEETKRKMSENRKGRIFSNEWRKHLSEAQKGKHQKLKWLTPEGEIIEMLLGTAKRWHPDWKLIN